MKDIFEEYFENLVKKCFSFVEHLGKIEFHYAEIIRNNEGYYHIHETVPARIVKQGDEAVREYALAQVKKAKERWRRKESIEDDIRKNNISIKTKYKPGILLEGRIIEVTSKWIMVELDKPLRGSSHINFGYGAAIVGQHVFTKDHIISKHGYDGARQALCWAYEDALNKPKKDLVERLNRS